MAVPGVGSGFGDLYISSNTIHGYVKLIDGATSYKVFYRPSSESSAKSVTADSKGYFFITGLKDNTEYTLNYHGINSSGGGSNMATGHTVNVKNGRNAWTLFSDSA